MKYRPLVFLLFAAFSLCRGSQAQEKAFYVAPTGSDTAAGTLAKPFATPERARDAVRNVRIKQPKARLTVYFRGGTYFRTAAFALTEADAGTVYRRYKSEPVTLHGGKRIPITAFAVCRDEAILRRLPPESRGKVMTADLAALGIVSIDPYKQHGFGTPVVPSAMDFFANGNPQTRARYPNTGLLPIGKVLDTGSQPRNGDRSNRGAVFTYEYDRPSRWTEATDIWLHGKFSFGYADDSLQVKKIDTTRKTIQLAQPHIYGVFPGTGHIAPGNWTHKAGLSVRGYVAYNLLEEIDQPGEWYVDRESRKIYWYPSIPVIRHTMLDLSLLTDPFIEIRKTSNIRIEGIKFECARGMGIYQETTHHVTINGCQFTNLGTVAVSLGEPLRERAASFQIDGSPRLETVVSDDFHDNAVTNCLISNMGTGGVRLTGGDRKTLTPANNRVVGCEFHHIGRINETYSPSVSLAGVGNSVTNCYFHDIGHEVVAFSGNDHRIERNLFERTCTNADDMGAIYTGRNPSARGTVIRHNRFENNRGPDAETQMCGIYIDDGSGGVIIEQNLFYRTGSPGDEKHFGAIFFHGGHDNIVRENVFAECDLGVGAIFWADKRWRDFLQSPQMTAKLREEVDITSDTYQTHYPALKDYFEPVPSRVNLLERNVTWNAVLSVARNNSLKGNTKIDAAEPESEPGERLWPILLSQTSLGRAIPLTEIGLQKEAFRKWHP